MASNTNQNEQKTMTAEELAAQTTGAQAPETKPETKMVKIKLPITKENKQDVYVSVNHRTYQIQRGRVVEVPDFVAEVLQHQEEMQQVAMAFEEENQYREKT